MPYQHPKVFKAPVAQQTIVLPTTPLAREMENYCRDHRKARISPYQTPLWCDRYADCLHCLMDFANHKVMPDGTPHTGHYIAPI